MTEFVQNLLFAVITASVPVLTYYLLSLLKPIGEYIKKLLEKLNIDTDTELTQNLLNNIFDTIYQVVSSTSQTYVDSLKASGSFNEEAQKKAFEITKNKILALLSEEAKELIVDLYSDLDSWLDVQIEAAVRNNKLTK